MSVDVKTKAAYTCSVIFDTLFNHTAFPFEKSEKRVFPLNVNTAKEAVAELEKQYDNRENSSWTAWILYVDIETTTVQTELDSHGHERVVTNVKTTHEVVEQRLRTKESYQTILDVRAARDRADELSGRTAVEDARTEEWAANKERVANNLPEVFDAELAWNKFMGYPVDEVVERINNANKAVPRKKVFGIF